jgi:hypothetical protein
MTREAIHAMAPVLNEMVTQQPLALSNMHPCDGRLLEQPMLRMQDPNIMRQTHVIPCFAQIRRDPFEVVVSGYLYHKSRSERWTRLPLKRTTKEAEAQRVEKERRLLRKINEQWPRSIPMEMESPRARERFMKKSMKEYDTKLKAPYGPWTNQFIKSTVALASVTSPGGALRGILPAPYYNNESYSSYLNRLAAPLGLLAEFVTAAAHTLPQMQQLYRRAQREKKPAATNSTPFQWSRCISSSTCLSDFSIDDRVRCVAAWNRLLILLGFPQNSIRKLSAAASSSCGASGPNKRHAASVQSPLLAHLVDELRRVDQQYLNYSLLMLSREIRCPLSKSYRTGAESESAQ